MLKFSKANAKTESLYNVADVAPFLADGRKVYSCDLSSGHSCPGACDCLSKAVPRDDDPSRFTIKDGPKCRFRCFSASQEVQYPALRNLRRHNFDALRKMRGADQCFQLYRDSLPTDAGVVRLHVGGDFFKKSQLQGVIKLAIFRPDVLFYAYTKSLHLLDGIEFPANFRITVSRGGKYDRLIPELGIREAVVVFSEAEAESLGLEIDHDDSHAASLGGSFALLVHGTQPKGSEASEALKTLKGKGSYGRK